jgi:hypothetical protein
VNHVYANKPPIELIKQLAGAWNRTEGKF